MGRLRGAAALERGSRGRGGLLGSFANTVGVVGLAILFGLLPVAIIPAILPQAQKAVLAAVVTVVIVRGVMLFRSADGSGERVGRRTPLLIAARAR